jgi:GT2 family glycosyltransferase
MTVPVPLVSVCIANYNGEAVLADCIDSLLAQTGDIPIEIIIHDDASTDGSLALLHQRFPPEGHPQIRIIESRENVGFCIGNNRMAATAQGDYLLLLNNDAALASDALATLLAAARRQSPQGILSLPQLDWSSGVLVDRGCLLDPFYNPVPNVDAGRRDVAMVIGACLWIPRSLWHRVGGFPEWFESIAEDMYLCCLARLAGYPVQCTVSSYYRHRQGSSFGGARVTGNRLASTYRRRRLSERNKTYVMVLCSPLARLWLTLPAHLLLLAVEGLVLALIKRDARFATEIYANVFTSLLREWPRLMVQRRPIQSGRSRDSGDYGSAFTWRLRKLDLLVRHGVPSVR